MGIIKGTAICPVDDNTVFIIRKHGPDLNFTPHSKGSTLSRQTSINSYQSKASRLTLDEDLEALRAANIIFIRHVQREKHSQAQNKYTIVNTCGETLFYAVEITNHPPKDQEEKRLQFAVVNSQGEEVFDIDGHPGVKGYGAHATIRRDSTVLGNVAQTNKVSLCHRKIPSYLIQTPDGRTIQKILRQNSWKNLAIGFLPVNDFNVFSPDGSICKAKISRQKNAITLEEYSETDTYGLAFHTTDMDGKLKALLITAVLMLDIQLTEKTVDGKDYKSLIIRILICVILILFFIGMVALVVDNAIEFQKERPKRFPGQVPPP